VALDRRIQALERLFGEPGDTMPDTLDPDVVAVLDEYGSLKSSMSDKHFRGSPDGPVPIEPENIPKKILGLTYTQGEFRELAIARGLERRGYSASEIARRIPEYLAFFEELGRDEHIGATD
jgi:hypothetical protein